MDGWTGPQGRVIIAHGEAMGSWSKLLRPERSRHVCAEYDATFQAAAPSPNTPGVARGYDDQTLRACKQRGGSPGSADLASGNWRKHLLSGFIAVESTFPERELCLQGRFLRTDGQARRVVSL